MNDSKPATKYLTRREQTSARISLAFGAVTLLLFLSFWGAVVYVIAHFVLKYW